MQYTWQLALVLVPVYFIKYSVSCYIYYIISLEDLRVNDKSLKHILECGENSVCCEERLSQTNPTIGRVVKGTLQPLDGSCLLCIRHEDHEVARQTTTPVCVRGDFNHTHSAEKEWGIVGKKGERVVDSGEERRESGG